MKFTGRQVLVSVREREDGQWRFACWMRDEREESDTLVPFEEAWKGFPLRFEEPGWVVEAIVQEVLKHVKHLNETRLEPEDSDQLDLWGEV